jgi:hypothetical protein
LFQLNEYVLHLMIIHDDSYSMSYFWKTIEFDIDDKTVTEILLNDISVEQMLNDVY